MAKASGKPFPTCRLSRIRKRTGRCYELALKGVLQAPEWILVHGEVRGPEGQRIGHAWLEGPSSDTVYDAVCDAVCSREAYLTHFAGVELARYTCKEASANVVQQSHYGPWR